LLSVALLCFASVWLLLNGFVVSILPIIYIFSVEAATRGEDCE